MIVQPPGVRGAGWPARLTGLPTEIDPGLIESMPLARGVVYLDSILAGSLRAVERGVGAADPAAPWQSAALRRDNPTALYP